jgi:hypothetical protein
MLIFCMQVHSPLHGQHSKPCASAKRFYSDYVINELWNSVARNSTLVIASEELEKYPESVWEKVGNTCITKYNIEL